jgi:hypothetical protein
LNVDPLGEGFTPIEAFVLIKALDEDGSPTGPIAQRIG